MELVRTALIENVGYVGTNDSGGKSPTSAGSEESSAVGEVAYQRERGLGMMCDGRAKQIQRRRYKEPKGRCQLAKTLPVIPITPTSSEVGYANTHFRPRSDSA